MSNSLVSILVLSYKNLEFLYNCLDSIFIQDYNNIELIVSNDGADNFNIDNVNNYIQNKKKINITEVIINKNKKNLGTVKHINKLLDIATGDYIINIACDDEFSGSTVVSDLMNGFEKAPKNAMSIVAQTAMYNEDMSQLLEYYVKPEIQEAINTLEPIELYYKYLINQAIFPAASRIYKKEAFEKYGKFDENYFLIEDWTLALQQNKRGMHSYYIDVVCVNHRAGGVSHSKLDTNSFAQKMYFNDEINAYKNILNDDKLSKKQKKQLKIKYNWLLARYDIAFVIPFLSKQEKKKYRRNNIIKMLPRIVKKAPTELLSFFVNVPLIKIEMFFAGLYLISFANIYDILPKNYEACFINIIQILFIVNIGLILLKYILKMFWKLKVAVKTFKQKIG